MSEGDIIVVVRFLCANSLQAHLQFCVIFGCFGRFFTSHSTAAGTRRGYAETHERWRTFDNLFSFFLSTWGFMVDVRRALRSGDIR